MARASTRAASWLTSTRPEARSTATLATPGSPQTSWFVEALDTTSNLNGVAQAALGYDQRLRLGDFECLSETKGVTCTNTATGATLFISRESYQLS